MGGMIIGTIKLTHPPKKNPKSPMKKKKKPRRKIGSLLYMEKYMIRRMSDQMKEEM